MTNLVVGYAGAFPNGTLPILRVGRLAVDGPPAVIVDPIIDRINVEPASRVSITATSAVTDSGAWVWRVIAGPNATLTPAGPVVSFVAPSDLAGTSMILGVKLTVAGITSPETIFSVTVLPQTEWWWTSSGWIARTVEIR